MASTSARRREAASAWTVGDDPWADRTTTAPPGTSSQLLHEDRALPFQVAHHVEVVDDLFADVHGASVQLERSLDGVDRSFDTGAVAPWGRQENRSHASHRTHARP